MRTLVAGLCLTLPVGTLSGGTLSTLCTELVGLLDLLVNLPDLPVGLIHWFVSTILSI